MCLVQEKKFHNSDLLTHVVAIIKDLWNRHAKILYVTEDSTFPEQSSVKANLG